jgi:hypothetical protein
LIFACVGAAFVLVKGDKSVTVALVDSKNQQPIEQAIIQTEASPAVFKKGKFVIDLADAPTGLIPHLVLQVSAPGYISAEHTVFIPWWQKQVSTEISLEPTLMTGQIVDADTGQPVIASISVAGDALTETAPLTTDDRGYFTLSHLQPPVSVRVDAVGYKLWQTQLANDLSASPVSLKVELLPEHIIGTITDAQNGTAVPATVHLSDSQSTQQEVIADEAGHFEAIYLEPPVAVRVEAPGYELWQTQLAALDMVVGNPAFKMEVKLTPRTTMGILQAADTGQPLPGFVVTAGAGNRLQSVTTGSDGRFQLSRLQPGDTITVSSPEGFLPLEIVFNNEAELLLSLPPRQVIVLVRDSFANQPVVGAQVSFAQNNAATNAQGQAVLTRIPANGQFSVMLPGYQPAAVDYAGQETVEVVLTPTALQGVVRGSDTGQPLPQTMLYVGDTILRADDAGHFMVDLPATTQSLMVKSAGYHRSYGQLDQTGVITGGTPPFSGAEGRWVATAPCVEPQPGPPCVEFVLEPFQAKGIYVSLQLLYERDTILQYLDFIEATELNAIVIDVKGDYGFIGWDSNVELAETIGAERQKGKNSITLDELIAEAKKRGIYTIGRFVVFKDNPLANGKPELGALRADGTVWIDGEDLAWANPFKEEVWDYNIALAKEMAEFGFDEINFDYIRFPSDGEVGAIVYEEENTLETRTAAIREFITRMRRELEPYGIFVSADVFGLTIWVRPDSDMKIGQRVIDIAPQLDYLAPMVYPSTFIPGNLGYDNPSAEPYNIVYRSQIQAEERVPPYVKVRPWLQGYWYSLDEMKQLKQAAIDSNSTGWTVWNAAGNYDPGLNPQKL